MFAGENLSAASGVWRKRPRSRPHLRRPPQLAKVWVWAVRGSPGRRVAQEKIYFNTF